MPIYHNTDEEVDYYCNQLKKCKILSVAEERLLWKEFHLDGISEERKKQIQDKMVQSCLRLVVDIAKKYRIQQVPFMDIISEGNLGLLNALNKFDHTKGFRFSSYAQWWVKQSILKFLAQKARLIKFPRREETAAVKIVKLSRQYFDEFGVEPPLSYLSRYVGIEEAKIPELMALSQEVSLNSRVSESEDSHELIDFLSNDRDSFEGSFVDEVVISEVRQSLEMFLSEREQRIIALRFGLYGLSPTTLEDVGKILDITKERVRQIEKKSINKLDQDRTRSLL